MKYLIGEALVGDGNEVAHIDLQIGTVDSPAGIAVGGGLANQKDGFSSLLAVITPNVPVRPWTVMYNKVTIKGARQAVQMFAPAQAAVARAVAQAVKSGVIPKEEAPELYISCGVFIHWEAADDKKIYEYNLEATGLAIERAMKGEQTVEHMLSHIDDAHALFDHNADAA